TLDDGTAGLVAVKSRGGVTVAQDPSDALFPGMPESAVRFAKPAYVAPIRELAALVTRLVGSGCDNGRAEQRPEQEERTMDDDPDARADAAADGSDARAKDQEGSPSELNCPECGGTLWEKVDGELLRFRCRVGHAYSPESLFSHQLESLDGALWAAVVALQ